MKVKELIEVLSDMPQDAEVSHVWDGTARTKIELVWLSKGGIVVTCDFGMVVYDDKDRPISAPTERACDCWFAPNSRGEGQGTNG